MQKAINLILYLILSAAFLASACLLTPLRGFSFWCMIVTVQGGMTLLLFLSLFGDLGHFPVSIRYGMILPPALLIIVELLLFWSLGLWGSLFPRIYGAIHIILWAAVFVTELILGKGGAYIRAQDKADESWRAASGTAGLRRHGTKTEITNHQIKNKPQP